MSVARSPEGCRDVAFMSVWCMWALHHSWNRKCVCLCVCVCVCLWMFCVPVCCSEALLIKDPLCTWFHLSCSPKSTQLPPFSRFLEMEKTNFAVSVAQQRSRPLPSVQYPDSVSCLSPLALTSPKWGSGFRMIKVVLPCCSSLII